jgi:hypothetical protein
MAFWVPLVIAAIPLPGTSAGAAAIAVGILKLFASLTHVTGIFDIMANVGSFALLHIDKAFLEQEGSQMSRDKIKEIDDDLIHLKKELNPTKFGGFCVWLMMLFAVGGFMEFFLPGSGTILGTVAIPHVHTFVISQAEVIHAGSALGATAAIAGVVKVYEKVKKPRSTETVTSPTATKYTKKTKKTQKMTYNSNGEAILVLEESA